MVIIWGLSFAISAVKRGFQVMMFTTDWPNAMCRYDVANTVFNTIDLGSKMQQSDEKRALQVRYAENASTERSSC